MSPASSSPSLLSSPLPSPATLFSKKPPPSLRAVSGARRGVRVVAAAAAAGAPVSVARARPSVAEVARTVAELAPSGTLSVVGRDGWPLGVGARFVTDAAGAPALCLANADVAAPDARSSFHVEVSARSFVGARIIAFAIKVECFWFLRCKSVLQQC
jgi:hypothetical protein